MENDYVQLCFDRSGNIMEEIAPKVRELTIEERIEFDQMTQCANQMELKDFIG